MSTHEQQPPDDKSPGLQGSAEAMSEANDRVEITLRLRNPLNRAIHYISDVRAMTFDPTTRRLRVRLSDRGREVLPAAIAVEPKFRVIDPHSEALITVRLPKTIVKLASTPSPTREAALEEHAVTNADEIEIEIGWADTAYYRDPRTRSRDTSSVSAWEQQSLRILARGPRRRERPD